MKSSSKKIIITAAAVLLLAVLLVLPAGAADNQTVVDSNVTALTVTVDDTILGWGYQVKVDGNEALTPSEKTCTVTVSRGNKSTHEGGSTVQILVGGTSGLPTGWYLTVAAVNCSYDIPENNLDAANKYRVDVDTFTADTASVTVTAHNDTQYMVTFDPDNGEDTWSEYYAYGVKIVQPEDPVKTGYLLEGWYNGSAKWDFANDVVQSDMTLTAHWTPVTYSVKFNPNGGSGSMDDQQFVYDVSQNLTVNAYYRSSYSFQGWAESATGSVVYRNHEGVKNLSSVQDDVVDLYAVWQYNGGGGGGGGSSTPVKPVVPEIVDEYSDIVDFQKIITIPAVDEDGNYVVLPVVQLIMTYPVTGTVAVKDMTEYYNSLTIVPSLKETAQFITEYRVETIMEALAAGIPVYENYIGGNGHAPVLIEDSSLTVDPVKFYRVIEIITNVTGGNLQEIIFKVPLAELTEQGFTTTDVVLYHGVKEGSERIWYPLVTTLEWCDETYAYYAAMTDGASPFGIMFLKDSTCVVPVSSVSPDSQTTETTASSPMSIVGILAGLGAGAAVLLKRRK